MPSKPKSKTYSVLYFDKISKTTNGCRAKYFVGAKSPSDAEAIVRKKVGKYNRVRIFREEPEYNIPYGKAYQSIELEILKKYKKNP